MAGRKCLCASVVTSDSRFRLLYDDLLHLYLSEALATADDEGQSWAVMQRSSVDPLDAGARTRETGQQINGAPVYALAPRAGLPAVGAARLSELPWLRHPGTLGAHAHDFVTVVLVDRGDSELWVGGRNNRVLPGDLMIIAPGEVVTPGTAHPHHGIGGVDGRVVFFDPHLLTGGTSIPPSWSRQPLLLPRGPGPSIAQHLHVPETEMPGWLARFASLQGELAERRDGFTEAALAHLVLLLVDVARLAERTGPTTRLRDEPLLAKVFAVIDERYRDQLSLRDVAAEVGLTPGHLSTVVGRRTGRTVQQWITERRMAEARTLLTESTAPVAAIARRVGYQDASYFIKHFRRAHQLTPGQWREVSR